MPHVADRVGGDDEEGPAITGVGGTDGSLIGKYRVGGQAGWACAEMGRKDAPKIERSARQHGQPHAAPTQLKDEL